MSGAELLKTKPIQLDQDLKDNEKAVTTIVIDENRYKDTPNEIIEHYETEIKSKSPSYTVLSVVLEEAVESGITDVKSLELHHDGKSRKQNLRKYSHRDTSEAEDQKSPIKPHQNFGGSNYGGNYDYGAPLDYDSHSRNSFVKLVFAILLIMLCITGAFLFFVLITPPVKEFYLASGMIMMILSMIIMTAMNYVMVCSACSRVPPCNIISLVIAVIAMSNLVAAVSVRYRTHIIIFALVATTVTVAVCLLLACTSFDFTAWYLYVVAIIVVFSIVSMMVSVAMLIMGIRYKPLTIAMLFVGALLNVVVLIMELQMILGGKSIEMSENDYALGAYMLYNAIVNLFLNIVQMLGILDD